MTRDDCILLGYLKKTHGVRGELILRTNDRTFKPRKKWGTLFLEIDGILVPFFIAKIHHLRDLDWVVDFDEIRDKTRAQSLSGCNVWVLRKHQKSDISTSNTLQIVGFKIHDKASGKTGVIREYIDIQENPLLNVEIEGENHMIPFREKFIIKLDASQKNIIMELPGGLI